MPSSPALRRPRGILVRQSPMNNLLPSIHFFLLLWWCCASLSHHSRESPQAVAFLSQKTPPSRWSPQTRVEDAARESLVARTPVCLHSSSVSVESPGAASSHTSSVGWTPRAVDCGSEDEESAANVPPSSLPRTPSSSSAVGDDPPPGSARRHRRRRRRSDLRALWDARWSERLSELSDFKSKHGHTHVPPLGRHAKLGRWVANQRNEARNADRGYRSSMTAQRREALDAVGFEWDARGRYGRERRERSEARWNAMLERLREFRSREGHCSVPARGETAALGRWVRRQRAERARRDEGKPSGMTPGRIAALDELNFVWDSSESKWGDMLERLREFNVEHDHTNVPQKAGKLGLWVMTQRAEYRKLKSREPSKLSPERRRALESIGFVWDACDYEWRRRLEELLDFKREHGHTRVPPDHGPLGTWVLTQRVEYRKMMREQASFLTEDRLIALVNAGFSFDPFQEQFEERLVELRQFREEHGHLKVGRQKGAFSDWYYTQRRDYRRCLRGEDGAMSDKRRRQLEDVGFSPGMFRDFNDCSRRVQKKYVG